MGDTLLELRNVRKNYDSKVALKDVSFRVAAGETLGFLGPNGAGKTTTVSIIAGIVSPDSGDVLIEGRALKGDMDPRKGRIGLVPQELALFEDLSAVHNLQLFGALYGIAGKPLGRAVEQALEFAGLAERANEKVRTFSGGMKRRLNMAIAFLHDPVLIVLDEPTVGVDPQSRNAIFETLQRLKTAGKTLLYTTHYMEEAERLCDRIVIVDHGEVIADDTLPGLSERVAGMNVLKVEIEGATPGVWLDEILASPYVTAAEFVRGELKASVTDLGVGSATILDCLARHALRVTFITSERAGLEAVFLALTGNALRDG